MKGLIVKGIGGFYYVRTESGVIEAKGRGIFKKDGLILCVGDEVDISILPEDARRALQDAVRATEGNDVITVQLAINYGGQAEICQAVNRALSEGIREITPEVIRAHFDNPEVPPVEIIARSAGEKRLSNFLLFDSAYAEFAFYDKLWPDWDENDVCGIIDEFNTRVRKFGGLA